MSGSRSPLPARRVVHYVDADLFGGSEQAALHLMAALDRTRWEPLLLHHPAPGIARLTEGAVGAGIRTVAVPRVVTSAHLTGMVRLVKAIRAVAPTIFHAHLSWPLACKHGILAARLARVSTVVGTAQLYTRLDDVRGARLRLRAVQRIIAVSREVEVRYARELGVPAARLAVVPNGIRVPPALPGPKPALRAELARGRPDYLVLTPARLHEQKGHVYLLAAAALVPGATFIFAGDGPLRVELERQARELGVASRCLFLGERTDVPDLLASADLFVLPSLWEGLPLSVLEAMAAGRPVVATAIGGTDEAVTDGVTGLLVPPRDPAALAAAITRLRADPELARRLGQAGRARAEQEFSSEVTAERVMRIYDEVAGPPAGKGRA